MIAAILGALGCATPPGTAAKPSPSRDRNVITRAELEANERMNLYDAIRNLRPAMIRSRGQTGVNSNPASLPRVYMDGRSYGDIGSLRNVPVSSVREVRFLNSSEATIKFGTNHGAGVIEVSTWR